MDKHISIRLLNRWIEGIYAYPSNIDLASTLLEEIGQYVNASHGILLIESQGAGQQIFSFGMNENTVQRFLHNPSGLTSALSLSGSQKLEFAFFCGGQHMLHALLFNPEHTLLPTRLAQLNFLKPHLKQALKKRPRNTQITAHQTAIDTDSAIFAFNAATEEFVGLNELAHHWLRTRPKANTANFKLLGKNADIKIRQGLARLEESAQHSLSFPLYHQGNAYQLNLYPWYSEDTKRRKYNAIVSINEKKHPQRICEQVIADVFDLTHSEACICKCLCQGLSLEDIAEHRYVSLSTVRSQVKSIMQKTQTHRQTQLVAKILPLVL